MPRRFRLLLLAVCCGTLVFLTERPGWAQIVPVDSTSIPSQPPDSLIPHPPDSLSAAEPDARSITPLPPPGWFPTASGEALVEVDMARTRYVLPAQVLSEHRDIFLYDTGLPGWPVGWSLFGLSPSTGRARLNGLRFEDPFTGAGLIEILPVELLQPAVLSLDPDFGGPTLAASIRPLAGRPPLTEIRYAQGSNKLAFISVLHSQDRNRTVLGRPTRLNVLLRYGGRGSTGAYPSSAHRLRSVYVRMIAEQSRWLTELAYLRTAGERGGQAGALPRAGQGFDSVYETFSPSVRLSGAEHHIDRHDISLRTRIRWLRTRSPLTLATALSPQTNRFSFAGESIEATARQWSLRADQPVLDRSAGRLSLSAEYAATRIGADEAFSDSTGATRRRWSIGLTDSLSVRGNHVSLKLSLLGRDAGADAGLLAAVHRTAGPLRLYVLAGQTFREPSHVDRFGFGETFTGSPDAPVSRIRHAQASVGLDYGQLTGEVRFFMAEEHRPLAYRSSTSLFQNGPTIVTVGLATQSLRSQGSSVLLGARRDARRGFYGALQGGVLNLTSGTGALEPHLASSLPEWSGEAHLGLRVRLFKGDLDLDARIRARSWARFRSRTLHPQTGLFVLTSADDLTIGPSGTVDFYVQGQIRTATVFVQMENMLSGSVYPGTLLVPIYPLPALEFRFGVFWPLLN